MKYEVENIQKKAVTNCCNATKKKLIKMAAVYVKMDHE
jgi:hypothetical protein